MSEPTPTELVHQLDEALHGYSVARPVSPKQRWSDLLDEVSRLACTCPPGIPPIAYDCDTCAAQHRRNRDAR